MFTLVRIVFYMETISFYLQDMGIYTGTYCVPHGAGTTLLKTSLAALYGQIVDAESEMLNVPWWHHQMETFSALLAICAGKGQWRGALVFSLICVCINGSVNNREAGDLGRYRVH